MGRINVTSDIFEGCLHPNKASTLHDLVKIVLSICLRLAGRLMLKAWYRRTRAPFRFPDSPSHCWHAYPSIKNTILTMLEPQHHQNDGPIQNCRHTSPLHSWHAYPSINITNLSILEAQCPKPIDTLRIHDLLHHRTVGMPTLLSRSHTCQCWSRGASKL